MFQRASNAGVHFFLARVKFVPNFTLFYRKSELCRDFALLGGILKHILELYVIFFAFFWAFWNLMLLFGIFLAPFWSFWPFALFCRELDLS